MTLEQKVAASLTRYNMLTRGDRVGVAVSGGADSVTLLHVLHATDEYRITVLHVNHHLRGIESDGDEAFVRELAARLGLGIKVHQGPVGEGNREQAARDIRREFFARMQSELNLRHVALGHTQTDQAETVLYRFLRGSGLAGLAGMSPISAEGLIRPMLEVTREEVRDWLAAKGIVWREDSSNQDLSFVRNRLRFEAINPQLVRVLAASAEVARDEEDWWTIRTEELYRSLVESVALGVQFQVKELRRRHPAEQRRLIRRAIRTIKGNLRSIDFGHVEGIRKLLGSEAGHDRILIPGVDSLRSFGTLLLAQPAILGVQPRHYSVGVILGVELALPYGGGRLYVNRVKSTDQLCAKFGKEAQAVQGAEKVEIVDLDGDVLQLSGGFDSWRVRNWEPGDEFRRANHEKSEKIKALFQEYRVLLWERRRWPVLEINNEIVWSRRFGAAAKFQANDESRDIVRLFYAQNGSFSCESNQ